MDIVVANAKQNALLESFFSMLTAGTSPGLKGGGTSMNIFAQALYFSVDLLPPPPHTYFFIDFKEISSTILANVKGQLPPNPAVATPRLIVTGFIRSGKSGRKV